LTFEAHSSSPDEGTFTEQTYDEDNPVPKPQPLSYVAAYYPEPAFEEDEWSFGCNVIVDAIDDHMKKGTFNEFAKHLIHMEHLSFDIDSLPAEAAKVFSKYPSFADED